jgi:alkyl hydroperoxide reductase subunit AhpC
MTHTSPLIGSLAPSFDLPCARVEAAGDAPKRCQVSLSDYRGRWLILVFYPHDFSMVCPTELLGLSGKADEFRSQGCDLLGVSCDPIELHLQGLATPQDHGGVHGLAFPLASDPEGTAARDYGVYLEFHRAALRGLFIIDPNGVLQYQAVHNLSVARRTDDIVRIFRALQSGGLCGENWTSPSHAIDPSLLLIPGYRLGSFLIEGVLGTGSFATVFRARDVTLDRKVALKVLRPGSRGGGRAMLAEARTAASLSHPNICTIYAVDETLGSPIIAMEYVSGRPLSAEIGGTPLDQARAAAIGHQIASGMTVAHARGVVHGDLKPENVMISDGDAVTILDFGLARRRPIVSSPDETIARGPGDSDEAGGLFGTPSYLSPELAIGQPATEASDVFTFGLLVYEMLTGRRAFEGSTVLEVLDRVRSVDPEELAGHVPEPFTSLIFGALQPDPAQRSLRMSEIAETLAAVSEARGVDVG